MTVIEVSDNDAAALTAKAARQGLTLDGWLRMMAQDGSSGTPAVVGCLGSMDRKTGLSKDAPPK